MADLVNTEAGDLGAQLLTPFAPDLNNCQPDFVQVSYSARTLCNEEEGRGELCRGCVPGQTHAVTDLVCRAFVLRVAPPHAGLRHLLL